MRLRVKSVGLTVVPSGHSLHASMANGIQRVREREKVNTHEYTRWRLAEISLFFAKRMIYKKQDTRTKNPSKAIREMIMGDGTFSQKGCQLKRTGIMKSNRNAPVIFRFCLKCRAVCNA